MISLPVTMSPGVNNKMLRDEGKDEHAAPEHIRITCKCSQASKIQNEYDKRYYSEEDE